MKNLIPVYLLLFLMLLSMGSLTAQNRGKVISGNQIIVFDPGSGIFKIQNMNNPGAEVGDSVGVDLEQRGLAISSTSTLSNQLVTSIPRGSDVGEILSMSGDRGKSGQIMYKVGEGFALINYENQRFSADLVVGSCVGFKIRSSKAVKLQSSMCDF